MEWKKYRKCPVTGNFYEVKEKGFTPEEWEEFVKDVDRSRKKRPLFTFWDCFWIGFFVTAFSLAYLKIWGFIWQAS